MDYTQLKTFTVVAYTGNITQAAEKLFLSQPAVSAQIKAIESQLNITLFKRNTTGMSLTIAGEVFLPQAEALLQHHHKLECFTKTLAENYESHAELGLIHPADPDKISHLTQKILATDTNIQLHIQYGMSDEIEQRIMNKQLHGGFFLGTVKNKSLRSIFLENIHYSLICPEDKLEMLTSNLPTSLGSYAWIEMSSTSASSKNLKNFWRQHRISPKQQIICDYPQTIIDFVCEGMGVAIVPTHKANVAKKSGKPISIIENYHQLLPMSFIYLDEYEEDPSLKLLKDCVQQIWQVKSH